MNRAAGLTLIELIATLAIGSMLIAVALPSLSTALDRQRAAAAHNLLLATFNQARSAAVTERRQTVVCPSLDGSSCRPGGIWEDGWIVFVDRDGNGEPGGLDTLIRHEASGTGSLRLRSSPYRPLAKFHRSGLSAGNNLTLRICNSAGEPLQGLVVNNGGRVRRTTDPETAALEACVME
jgi:type IV fimbrial biogenesis protein FimT